MSRIAALPILLAVLLAGWGSDALANKRIALLIGNKDYDTRVGTLTNPLKDIEVVGKALQETGFVILPPLKNAMRRQILAAVADYAAKLNEAGSGTIGVLYYSGHGVSRPEDKSNYLIPVDVTDLRSREAWFDTVPLEDILAELKRTAPSTSHFVIFDACRSELQLPTKDTTKGFTPVAERPGMFIALATAPNDVASDLGDASGPYAAALSAELVKPGLSHLDVFQNIKQEVNSRTGGRQVPWERNGLLTRVYFKEGEKPKAQAPVVAAKTEEVRGQSTEELLFWNDVKELKNAAELKEFIRQYPNSNRVELAKVRIASLESSSTPPAKEERTKSAVPKQEFLPQIIGGTDAQLKDWPWMATLRTVNPTSGDVLYVCQGAVIAPQWVLTVANCAEGARATASGITLTDHKGTDLRVEVVLGVDNLATVQPRDVYKVKRAIIRETWDPAKHINNIALFELEREWWGEVARLSLDAKFDPPDGAVTRIPGFGHGREAGDTKAVEGNVARLAEVDVPVVSNTRCNAVYKGRVPSSNICAGYEQGGKDGCQGNSGAPLTAYTNRGCPYPVGIVSWGEGCARPMGYSVHERLSSHADWLRHHVPDVQGLNDAYLADCRPRGKKTTP